LKKLRVKKKISFWLNELLFVGPIFLVFIIIKIWPLFLEIYYSFLDWNGVSDIKEWVGFANYLKLWTDSSFTNSLIFTAKYMVVVVIASNVIAFSLAYALSKPLRARNLMRAGFFLPYTLGGLVLGYIWSFIFTIVFPKIGELTGIGIFSLPWIGSSTMGFWALAVVETWRFMGYLMLLYIAGLTTVPAECIEAATVDGAGKLRILRNITLPLIMPTITRCTFLSILTASRIFEINLALTNGGPYRSTEALVFNIYQTAFKQTEMGYGSAKALIYLLIIVIISLVQVYFTSKKEVEL